MKAFVMLIDSVANMLFWLAFIFAAYWLFFFKGQNDVSVLLPDDEVERNLKLFMIVAACGKIIRYHTNMILCYSLRLA